MYPFLQVLLAAVLFGISTPLSKPLLGDWSSQQLAGLLYLGAALGAAAPILIGKARGTRRFWSPSLDRANLSRLAGAILCGGVGAPIFLLLGLRLAQAASVSLWLNFEMVATAAVGALCFKDHLGKAGWLGCGCVLAAGLCLSLGEGAAGLGAGLCIVLACAGWGVDNNLMALIDGLDPLQSTFWKGLCAGACNFGFGLILQPHMPDGWKLAPALATGIFGYGVSLALYVSAAQSLGATRSQMAFASAPVFGLALSHGWLGEGLTAYHAIALGLQALGVYALFRDRHDHAHSHPAIEHVHSHQHGDGHHNHAHPGPPPPARHTHAHRHEPLTHTHPHWPDLHHRHSH